MQGTLVTQTLSSSQLLLEVLEPEPVHSERVGQARCHGLLDLVGELGHLRGNIRCGWDVERQELGNGWVERRR